MLTLTKGGTWWAPGLAAVSLALLALCSTPANAGGLSLTTIGSTGTVNDAMFLQFDPDPATGTGLIDSFVRVQAAGVEEGYNTDGEVEFDTKTGLFTHSLMLSAVPLVGIGEVDYREFLLDVNEGGGNNSQLSLDELKIYVESTGDLTGYPSAFGTAVYDLDSGGDNWIVLDADLQSGSGSGDMRAWIPSASFGTDETRFVYLYSKFGVKNAANIPVDKYPALLELLRELRAS